MGKIKCIITSIIILIILLIGSGFLITHHYYSQMATTERLERKRVIITRIEKRRPHLYTGITDEISFLLDSFTMFLNIFCPW